ncbi:MAG: sensor histidine kinase [Gemmatirosa sp.]
MPPVPALAALAHELRTPLHGMSGLVSLLRTTALDDEQRAHVDALDEAAAAMLRLVEDALTLARLEAGAVPEEDAVACAPRALLDAAARTLAPLAAARGLALALEVAADAPATVRTQPDRVRQVLLNLAGNAIKYTRRGEVRLRARGDGASGLALDVVDTGPGLTAAQRARLFRAWERLDAEARDDGAGDETDGAPIGGSGLGLVLARALATRLGGRLAVASVHGAGSTFTLVLPVERTRG